MVQFRNIVDFQCGRDNMVKFKKRLSNEEPDSELHPGATDYWYDEDSFHTKYCSTQMLAYTLQTCTSDGQRLGAHLH